MSFVDQKIRDSVALLTMNNPGTFNAMDEDLGPELARALEGLSTNDEVRSVVLTGAGGVFSGGGNVVRARRYMEENPGRGAGVVFMGYTRWVHRVAVALSLMPQPVISAVEGAASGAGLSWMLLSDMVVLSRDAKLVPGFLAIGLGPGAGAGLMLPGLLGQKLATELLFLNRRIEPERALDLGLADELVRPGRALERALTLAGELARRPGRAMSHIKRLLRRAFARDLAVFLEDERKQVIRLADGPEFAHLAQRFVSKKNKP